MAIFAALRGRPSNRLKYEKHEYEAGLIRFVYAGRIEIGSTRIQGWNEIPYFGAV